MYKYRITSFFIYVLFFLIIFGIFMMVVLSNSYGGYKIYISFTIILIFPIFVILATPYMVIINNSKNIIKIKYYFGAKKINILDIISLDIMFWKYNRLYMNLIIYGSNKKWGFPGNIRKRDDFIKNLLEINNKIIYKIHDNKYSELFTRGFKKEK